MTQAPWASLDSEQTHELGLTALALVIVEALVGEAGRAGRVPVESPGELPLRAQVTAGRGAGRVVEPTWCTHCNTKLNFPERR